MDKKVSIIIPAYNVEKEVEDSLNSILKQTYSNLDIIIINDGSTDNTLNIVESITQSDDRVRIINQINSGQSVARNKGLKLSVGEYVYFFDADDILQANAIEKLVNSIERLHTDIVTFNADTRELNNKVRHKYVRHGKLSENTQYSKEQFLEMNKWNLTPVWIYFFRKQFLIDNSILFKEGIIYEDNLFYIDIIDRMKTISFVNESLFLYQRGKATTTTSIDNKQFKVKSLEEVENIIQVRIQDHKQKNIFLNFLKYRHAVIGIAIMKQHTKGNFIKSCFYMLREKKIGPHYILFLLKIPIKSITNILRR